MRIATMFLICAVISITATVATAADSREQARRIHDRLTGVPPTDAMLDAMQQAIEGSGGAVTAALYAMDGAPGVPASGDFYTVTLKNWVTPWTNEAQDVFAPLNDYSATVIGMVRDDADFREILSADVIYRGQVSGAPPYAVNNNNHYEFLEGSGANLGDSNVLVRANQSALTGLPAEGVAGVMTTRAAARAFFVDGTNRAMLRFTLLNHLCMDLEQLKDTTRPTDRIRQDVSRSPGGDSQLFINNCVACHNGMDPLAQAFAYYDFPYPDEDALPGVSLDDRKDRGAIAYTPGVVHPKHLINGSSFPTGYVTDSDHWANYWRLGDNSGRIGWRGAAQSSGAVDEVLNPAYSEGSGAASMGQELADTEAFAWCQVKKAFKNVCLREPTQSPAEAAAVSSVVDGFHSTHNMKQVFAEVAAYCASDF